MSSASSRPTSRSTTCAPRSGGAGKTPTSSWRWRWRRRCSRCGSARGRIREGRTWFDTALADLDAQHPGVAAAVRARALADKAVLASWVGAADSFGSGPTGPGDRPRDVDDPALLARTLTACGFIAGPGYQRRGWPGHASPRRSAWPVPWTIGGGSARSSPMQAMGAHTAGDPLAVRAAAEEGRDLADAIGDRFNSRQCRFCLGSAQMMQRRSSRSRRTVRRAGRRGRGGSRRDLEGDQPRRSEPWHSPTRVSRPRPERRPRRPLRRGAELCGEVRGIRAHAVGFAALAAGDLAAAHEAREAINQQHDCR